MQDSSSSESSVTAFDERYAQRVASRKHRDSPWYVIKRYMIAKWAIGITWAAGLIIGLLITQIVTRPVYELERAQQDVIGLVQDKSFVETSDFLAHLPYQILGWSLAWTGVCVIAFIVVAWRANTIEQQASEEEA